MKQIILVFAIGVALAFPISAEQAGAGMRTVVLHDFQKMFGAAPDDGVGNVIPASCGFAKSDPAPIDA